MTPDQIRKLGTEYSRFNMEANRRTEGTGLGMSITRNLVHLMKGSIDIESTPGMGSTFTVTLPQKRAGSSLVGKDLAENLMRLNHGGSPRIRTAQIKREFMPYGRVLVVDDVETNLYVAKGLLAPYGLSIDTAMSGFDAVDKIRYGGVYDIIFMDHMMPRMDGIEATKIIRSLGYKGPIVALTANALTGQAEMFLKNGFDDFISKPIDIRQLNMSLNKLIRDKQPPDVVEAARQQKNVNTAENPNVDSQLTEFFVRDAKKAINALETVHNNKCRKSGDLSAFIINVHAMKSALANVGENDLSALAARLEQAGRDHDITLVMSELPSFIKMLYAAVDKYEKVQEPSDGAEENFDSSFLKEKLLVITTACTVYDKKTAKSALSQIKQKKWPQSVRDKLGSISGYLLHSEFDEAVKFIEEYVKQL
jgi:CheY-like chemotaxis protein